jgi:hypothetical protein
MHFLYPGFLFALLTLAIPVVVHLFNFKRYKKVYFSNVQFLKEVQEQQASRRNLKERLILAARMLALLFLVLAFARPYLAGTNTETGKQQAVSIFIDNSYSMQTLNREGTLLDEAKQKARQIAAAYSINDRFQLLTQDFEGKHQRLLSRDEFNDEVAAVKVSPQSRSINQIATRQQGMLNMQASANRQSYIISDFQKNLAGKPLSTNIPINFIQLKANTLPNVAVDSVWLLNATHRPGENEKLVIRLHNYAAKSADKVPLKLIVNDVQKALGSYTVKERSVQNDTLAFSGLQAGWQRGQIQLQDNPVVFDNNFYFAFNVNKQLPVLLINGGTPNKYLNAVFASDAFFNVKNVQDGNVDYAGLSTYPLIVLSDIKTVSDGLAQQLKTYINKGGSLVFFPAVDADLANYKALLQPLGAAYPENLVKESSKVSTINLQSPVFKTVFESLPQNPDLPLIKKYFTLGAANKPNEYLMRLQTGQPFWQASHFGRGKIYVAAVALNEEFSNLPVHGLFVPVMFRIALLSGHDQPLFYTIGSDKPIETIPLQTTEKQLLKLVNANETIIPDVKQQEGSTLLYLPGQLKQTGIYQLKKQDSVAAVMAFNDNRAESDLSYLSANEISSLFSQKTNFTNGNKFNPNSIGGPVNSGMQLWKLCIILALICLAAETLLIRYYKTNKNSVTQPA